MGSHIKPLCNHSISYNFTLCIHEIKFAESNSSNFSSPIDICYSKYRLASTAFSHGYFSRFYCFLLGLPSCTPTPITLIFVQLKYYRFQWERSRSMKYCLFIRVVLHEEVLPIKELYLPGI